MFYLDLETVPQDGIETNEAWIAHKKKVLDRTGREVEDPEAALNGAFGKICAAVASIKIEGKWHSYSGGGSDERQIITELITFIDEATVKLMKRTTLCAFNGLEFDIPFLAHRILANEIMLPSYLFMQGKKPWELEHLVDPMKILKFSSWKGALSVPAVSHMLGIPSPKDDIDGSQVWECYKRGEYDRITRYCEKDVRNLIAIVKHLIKLGAMRI